jgi:gliding motility-associated-like protein
MKKLILLAFVLAFTFTKAQTAKELPGWDEQKARQEAVDKEIHPNDVEGYVRAARARYINELYNKKELSPEYAERITVASVNSNKIIGQTVLTSLCQNSDLSLANYTNWQGDIANNCTAGTQYPVGQWLSSGINGNSGTPVISNTDPCNGATVSSDRHVIMTLPIVGAPQANNTTAFANGYDPSCCNNSNQLYDLPMRPNNNTNSIRLGSAYPNYTCEKLVYPITVNSTNSLFTYQFAVVINDGGHGTGEQPAFRFAMKDVNGNVLTQGGSAACVQYDVDATQAQFDTSYIQNWSGNPCWNSGSSSTYYRKWRTVTIDLSAYASTTVYAEFEALDCIYSGHFCYAYISATCGALTASVSGFCGGVGSATMMAPQGFASYQWYGPNNNNPIAGATSYSYTANPASNGDVYSVDCVTLQGCTTKLQVTVAASNILATASANPSCQGGSTGSASVSVSGGTQYSYTWTPGGTNGTSISNQPSGPYNVTVHDLTGNCPDTTIAVTIGAVPPTLQTVTDSMCGGYIVLNAPQPGTNYQWYGPSSGTAISGATTPVYTVTGGTNNQYYTVSFNNSTTGCRDSIRTTLTQVNIAFTPVSSPPCNSGSNGSITITGQSSNTFPNYDWSMTGTLTGNGANIAMPPNAIQINNLPQGTYSVTIYPTGNTACTYTMAVTLIEGQLPPPVLDTLKGCALDNISVPTTTVNGNTHAWYTTTGTFLGTNYPYVTSGVSTGAVYVDSIRSAAGCLSVYKAYLKEKSFKVTVTSPEKVKCHDDSTGKIRVTATQEINGPLGTPYVFNWNYPAPYPDPAPVVTGSGVPQNSQVNNLHAGTYTCVVTSGNCVATATYNLTNPPLLLNDTLYANYCPKDSLVWLFAEPGHTNYYWVNNGVPVTGNNNDSILITTTALYEYITWYMQSGCRDTAKILVTGPAYHAFRPDQIVNIFTPNGDGKNDVFYPFYDPKVSHYEIDKQMEEFTIVIYNRWGKKVFETNQYALPWDGKDSGKALDDGTYYYICRYKSNCSTKADIIEKHGYVQLLR